MDTSNPGPLMMLLGGVLIAIGTLLDWRSILGFGNSGLSLDSMGLFGIIALIVGVIIAAVGAIEAFGLPVKLPKEILGHTLMQMLMVDAFVVFIWTFAWVAADFTGGGVHLTWLGAAVAMVGAGMAGRPATAKS